MIRATGHDVLAFVTADPDVCSFAREEGIRTIDPGADLSRELIEPFDHLFSIVNESILRDAVLNLPTGLAINYHDAPLPRYAGTHATSWALMNGETVHGVTWHLISETVDAGDILEQEEVKIDPEDTAFSLNLKCYEAALRSFGRLLQCLSNGNVVRRKQDLQKRTFFPRFKRPPEGGVIDFTQSAKTISALVRALNFGNQPNPLGCAKIKIDDDFYIVGGLSISGAPSTSGPGTIVCLDDHGLGVATSDLDVVCADLFRLDGSQILPSDLASKHALTIGRRLPKLHTEEIRLIEEAYRVTCKQETSHASRLSSLTPCEAPYGETLSKKEATYSSSQIPISDATTLASVASAHGFTEQQFLSAIFALMLWRLSGMDEFDIAFGVDDGREATVVDRLFEDRSPIRIAPEPSTDFMSFLSYASEKFSAEGKPPYHPIDLRYRYPALRPDGVETEHVPVAIIRGDGAEAESGNADHDLVLVVSEDISQSRFLYDSTRINDKNAGRLTQCVGRLIDVALSDPGVSIGRMPLIPSDEFRKVVFDWNDNATRFPAEKCIHELFEEQVELTPDRTALVSGGTRLTYAELNRRSSKLAAHLRSLDVGQETLIGVCLERSEELVVAILAILKAGGAYVPLDPAYPPARLMQILASSKAPLVLTTERLADRLTGHKGSLVYLDRDRSAIEASHETAHARVASSSDLAYVLYTSGSTGEPKGVAIEHRSVIALIDWARSVYSPEQLDGVLFSTSICFDLSSFEMFVPLCSGGKVILVENILHLPGLPTAEEVVLINTVPSAATELVRMKGIPASVRTVNLAGEPLRSDLVDKLYALGTVREVYDLYGPTEDTTYSTFALRQIGRPATIGRPISNTQAYVLDRLGQPVPVGIPGELYLAGEGLARGYLGRPDLTNERFVPNPFAGGNSRMYRTGDRARFRDDGQIDFLGRIDNQVKIRGFRIELGEIEACLLKHPDIREAVVMSQEDRHGDRQLVAYIVYEHKDRAVKDLLEYLKERLPQFMVPSALVELESLPMTPNGKIDRKALPKSSLTRPKVVSVESVDSFEAELIKIWERVLDVHPIGLTDNFFELGGHSLQAVRMFAEVEERFAKNIPLATLFEAGTIKQLADLLRQDGWAAPEASLVPIQTQGSKPPFFCIHAKGGNVLFYKDLARYMGIDQPFYGLQARRLAGRQVGHDSVEEMAAFYIKEIKDFQPQGPYYIGGSSFGGLAAFEIAQQLRKQGDEIGMLALLDTGTPDYPRLLPTTTKMRSRIYSAIRRFQHHRDSLMLLGNSERLAYVGTRLRKVRLKYRRRIRDAYKKTVRDVYSRVGRSGTIPKKYIQLENLIWKAGLKYAPRPYAGKVTLFRATIQPLGIVPEPTLGWDRYVTGELEIHDVPGHHGSIVTEPFVRVLAEKLVQCMEQTWQQDLSPNSVEHSNRQPQLFETARA